MDEDFAVESLAGDIMLLGNSSWRIRRVQVGRVLVEDAQGAPPNVPFWRGEAPARTAELSAQVSELREEIASRTAAQDGLRAAMAPKARLHAPVNGSRRNAVSTMPAPSKSSSTSPPGAQCSARCLRRN